MKQKELTALIRFTVDEIDNALGEDFAKKHPDLIAACIQTMIIDEGAEAIARAISNLHDAVRSDHPLQGETFSGLERALDGIAEAIEAKKEN